MSTILLQICISPISELKKSHKEKKNIWAVYGGKMAPDLHILSARIKKSDTISLHVFYSVLLFHKLPRFEYEFWMRTHASPIIKKIRLMTPSKTTFLNVLRFQSLWRIGNPLTKRSTSVWQVAPSVSTVGKIYPKKKHFSHYAIFNPFLDLSSYISRKQHFSVSFL